MEKTPVLIGDGTYGCVTKPSLKCANTNVNYSNKVSKVMLRQDAKDEYNEMKSITNIDGIHKYIVSLPDMCSPVYNKHFSKTLKTCNNERFEGAHKGDFKLLILEDGGASLRQFSDKIVSTLSPHDIHIFFSRVYNLLEGLCFFYEHNIVHHDIKARNIVYNIETSEIKFIDFGLMKKRSVLISESKRNKNQLAQKWDNFPPEYDAANKYYYDLNPTYNMSYDKFIERVAYTFDSYSLGLMMSRLLEPMMSMNLGIKIDAIEDMLYFFDKLATEDIESRDYNIYKNKEEYKELLKFHKIWNIEKTNPSEKSIVLQKSLSAKMDLSKKERTILKNTLSLYKHLKPCNENQIRNPNTRRCVRKCKPDEVRDKNFRCRKTVRAKRAQ